MVGAPRLGGTGGDAMVEGVVFCRWSKGCSERTVYTADPQWIRWRARAIVIKSATTEFGAIASL